MMEKTMRKLIWATAAGALAGLLWSGEIGAEVASLRGENPPDAMAQPFAPRDQVTQPGGFERDWAIQPPLIPHRIDEGGITLKGNVCMSCHGPQTDKAIGAARISDSHFVSSDGETTLDKRRYSCTQCHVPQRDAEPLTQNNYRPLPE